MPPFATKNQYRSKNGRFANVEAEKSKLKRLANLVRGKKKEKKITEIEVNEVVEGCRIVDIASFAKSLKCQQCNCLLDLKNIQKENRIGLLSTFLIKCKQCTFINHVRTTEMREHKDTKKLRSNVNSSDVLGAVHSGAGNTTLQKTPKMYKTCEHDVGKSVEETARESCKQTVVRLRQRSKCDR